MSARYHLVQRLNYMVLPWAVLAFAFAVDVVILALTPAGHSSHRYVGGLAAIFVLLFVLGLQSVARSLPFGLALGVSRRSYYLGTVGLAVALAAVYGLALTVAAGRRAGHRRLGSEDGLLPGAVHPPRAVVPHLADVVRGPGTSVRLWHVVRARLPTLEPGRPGGLHRWPGHRAPCRGAPRDLGQRLASTSAISSRPSAQWA